IKLGIVMIPTTTLMGARDLQDRVERGGAHWVAVGSANIGKFAAVEGSYTLIEVGAEPANTEALQYADSYDAGTDFTPDGPTRGDGTLL
ncbi:AMP-dependent synthetase, partial [Burkholderia sp. SIMBA_057]